MFFKSLKQLRETKEKGEWKKVPLASFCLVCVMVVLVVVDGWCLSLEVV